MRLYNTSKRTAVLCPRTNIVIQPESYAEVDIQLATKVLFRDDDSITADKDEFDRCINGRRSPVEKPSKVKPLKKKDVDEIPDLE